MDKLKIQTADMVERNIKMLGLMFYFFVYLCTKKKEDYIYSKYEEKRLGYIWLHFLGITHNKNEEMCLLTTFEA